MAEFHIHTPSIDSAPSKRRYTPRNHREFIQSKEYLGHDEEGLRRAYKEVSFINPDAEFLSGEGSAAFVFSNGEKSLVYKVSRGGRDDYFEHEASMIKQLGDAGFAPRLIAYHEPPEHFADDTIPILSYEDNFPHITHPQLTVPIIEMEHLNIPPHTPSRFDVLTKEEIRMQFKQLAEFAIEHHINLRADTEMTVDLDAHRLKFVDLGGIRRNPTLKRENYIAGALQPLTPYTNAQGKIRYLYAGDSKVLDDIRERDEQGGLDAVAELITVGREESVLRRLRAAIGHLAGR